MSQEGHKSLVQEKWEALNNWCNDLMADKKRFGKYLIALVAVILIAKNVVNRLS